MRLITIKLICKATNRFQVIGRGTPSEDGSRQDFSTTFTAFNNADFKAHLESYKKEYQLFNEKFGTNNKGEVIFQLS